MVKGLSIMKHTWTDEPETEDIHLKNYYLLSW